MMTLTALNTAERAEFVAALGGIFEHSPWVAEAVWPLRPFADREALHAAMVAAMHAAPVEQQLALIRAHPDLAGRAAIRGEITDDSKQEQASAGLNQCSPAEFATLTRLNDAYKARFDFPFIMAVRHSSRADIISAFETRLSNPPPDEFRRALEEIGKIAGFRLAALLG